MIVFAVVCGRVFMVCVFVFVIVCCGCVSYFLSMWLRVCDCVFVIVCLRLRACGCVFVVVYLWLCLWSSL